MERKKPRVGRAHPDYTRSPEPWTVVQQGMNDSNRYARRYHWVGQGRSPLSDSKDFTCEPHKAVCCDSRAKVLDMVSQESGKAREASTILSWENPDRLVKEINRIKTLDLPARHHVEAGDINPDRLYKIFLSAYEAHPKDFETLIGMQGVGPKTIRALSLIAELLYGAKTSVEDPVRFSFAHGGKDGIPFPVDRTTYEESINFLREAVDQAKVGVTIKTDAMKRLARFEKE